MKKPDVESFSPRSSMCIDKANAFFFRMLQCMVHVRHGKGDMVYALSLFLDEFPYGPFGIGGFQQFDLRVPHFKKCRLHLLVGHLFNGIAFQSQDLFILGDAFFQVGHRDANVFNVCRPH